MHADGMAPPIVALIDTSYPLGCRANESWKHRVSRYRYNWNQIAKVKGVSHIVNRVKDRYARMARKATLTVGVPLANAPSDVYSLQERAVGELPDQVLWRPCLLFRAESQEQEFFSGGLRIRLVTRSIRSRGRGSPGDHGSINTGTNLKILARKLKQSLGYPSANGHPPQAESQRQSTLA